MAIKIRGKASEMNRIFKISNFQSIVLSFGLLALICIGCSGSEGGLDEVEDNIADWQDAYEPQPLVSGETTFEIEKGITIADEEFDIHLSDGSKLNIPATGVEIQVSLERQSNNIDLEEFDVKTTGSMRVFSFSTPYTLENPGDFIPSITIPAKESGNIDPDTINMLRIGDCFIDGELFTNHHSFLPVHRDSDGNFVAIDPTFLIMAYRDESGNIAEQVSSATTTGILAEQLPNKVTYSLSTFQENLNWQTKPLLVRMVPDGSISEKRRVANEQDNSGLEKLSINVILLVHGHNEEEYAGFEESRIPGPWGVSYKRDVWTYLYDTFLLDHANYQECTFFYEFIYPTYRPAITQTGDKETLGETFGRLVNDDPILKKLQSEGTSLNLFIVSHSMGGLVSRAGLRFLDSSFLTNFKKLVTWGTPHHGSPLVTLRYAMGAYPGYVMSADKIIIDSTPITAFNLFQTILNESLQLDTPGTRDLRWDGGTSSDPFRLTLSDFLEMSFLQYLDIEKYDLEKGSWLYNHNLRMFNNTDRFRMSDKYAFLYGATTKRLELKEYSSLFRSFYFKTIDQTAIGATIIDVLIDGAETIEPDYNNLYRGDSDGAVPLFSASGKAIAGPYPPDVVYLGDIDHEEYFGSPQNGLFNAILLADKTARETFKALNLSAYLPQEGCKSKEDCKDSEEYCDDGLDNDCNGETDCDDIACESDPSCTVKSNVWKLVETKLLTSSYEDIRENTCLGEGSTGEIISIAGDSISAQWYSFSKYCGNHFDINGTISFDSPPDTVTPGAAVTLTTSGTQNGYQDCCNLVLWFNYYTDAGKISVSPEYLQLNLQTLPITQVTFPDDGTTRDGWQGNVSGSATTTFTFPDDTVNDFWCSGRGNRGVGYAWHYQIQD
jgi:hypothetical protein